MSPLSVPARPALVTGVPTACFSVHAAPDPGLLPRVVETFAKRGLVPSALHATLSHDRQEMAVDLQVQGLDDEQVPVIAAGLRNLVGVSVVLTSTRHVAR